MAQIEGVEWLITTVHADFVPELVDWMLPEASNEVISVASSALRPLGAVNSFYYCSWRQMATVANESKSLIKSSKDLICPRLQTMNGL